ncbi:menaquinone-dependent protoporphyrinogen oxidase [Salegentibacter echinorum]|uniref:Protoporphyrinogen IX dehydrogenase [quinone] n=1 Tax=Salegentibacter echinorum TaxID=1073325 RepID=A0A1M5C9J8_SALEC|nr:menaquinone-dependent protoporphyrinogen IX dehydrogenase [Salegentibacter echinorum]SHF51408.1 menaquinone-dependent protoporphyrinogen oxidase [Salegentibacter echinorum]
MTPKIGIIYSSVDGHTKKICETLKNTFEEKNITTELYSIEGFKKDFLQYDILVIGASIRYGKHNQKILDFIQNNKGKLKRIKTAFFSVNLVARKPEKSSPETNPYFIKFINQIDWSPDFPEVFAGRLDYQSYSFFDSLMIKLIMKLTKGPTKTSGPIEYTDWEKVAAFASKICEHYKIQKEHQSAVE